MIQKALGQMTGGLLVPVAFSFGWVAYSFSTLMAIAGDGRLMPEPDYDAKVINVANGYTRDNKSWVIGRLLRDFTTPLDDGIGLKVTIFEAITKEEAKIKKALDWTWWFGAIVIAVQTVLAAIPQILYDDWGILITTAIGIILSLITSALPQWRFEKWACRKQTKKTVCITGGNGTRHVMVIIGKERGLDLEDLAAAASPRLRRIGEAGRLSKKAGKQHDEVVMIGDYPAAYVVTQLSCLILAAAWIVFLITVSSLVDNQWFLMGVGGLGCYRTSLLLERVGPKAPAGLISRRSKRLNERR